MIVGVIMNVLVVTVSVNGRPFAIVFSAVRDITPAAG